MLNYKIKQLISVLFLAFTLNIQSQDELNSLQLLSKADMLLFNSRTSEAAQLYSKLLRKDSLNKYLNFLQGLSSDVHSQKTQCYLRSIGIPADTFELSTFIYEGSSYVLNVDEDSSFEVKKRKKNTGFKFDIQQMYTHIYFSDDNKTMVFLNATNSKNSVHISRFLNNIWSAPIDITPQLGSMGDCFPSSLNSDGSRLYLSRYDGFDGEILVSTFDGKGWSALKKLNSNVNTTSWEAHAYESPDGLLLYYASNRPGGFGGMDIYFSHRSNNDWGKAINIGQRINTFLDEDYPVLVNDGRCIIYSSQGLKKGKDKFEMYYSKSVSETQWTSPVILTYPFNTSDDDFSYLPFELLSRNFFYRHILNNEKPKNSNTLFVKTNISYSVLADDNTKKVSVDNYLKPNEMESFKAGNSGTIDLKLKEGFYQLEFDVTGLQSRMINVLIPVMAQDDTLTINVTLKNLGRY